MSNVNQYIANDLIKNVWAKMIRERSKSERRKYQEALKQHEREFGPVKRDRGYDDKALLNWDTGKLKPSFEVYPPIAPMPLMPDYRNIIHGEENLQNTAP